MAIIIKTNNPERLRTLIYEAIDRGELQTWTRRGATEQLTHVTRNEQWENLAWFTPRTIVLGNEELIFSINFPANVDLNRVRAIYAIYHGRFTEAIIGHFYQHSATAISTSRPRDYENLVAAIRTRLNA